MATGKNTVIISTGGIEQNERDGRLWHDLKDEITNPIGCQDCHDPKTMNLRISRPALREAWESMGKNIDEATHQEMRSLVCAQCHVEYYCSSGFKLTFPWGKGLTAEQTGEQPRMQ